MKRLTFCPGGVKPRWFVTIAAVAMMALVWSSIALAGYWNFSGNIPTNEGFNLPMGNGWYVRLSRGSACQIKMEGFYDVGGGWMIQGAPGGCSNTDWAHQFFSPFDIGMCYNDGGPTAWANCRIAASV
jgi:hypothetical protein